MTISALSKDIEYLPYEQQQIWITELAIPSTAVKPVFPKFYKYTLFIKQILIWFKGTKHKRHWSKVDGGIQGTTFTLRSHLLQEVNAEFPQKGRFMTYLIIVFISSYCSAFSTVPPSLSVSQASLELPWREVFKTWMEFFFLFVR